jgi:protein N-terminal glutamine amidohydrolase
MAHRNFSVRTAHCLRWYVAAVKQYTPFYCEENIWHLANDGTIDAVIFISNPQRQVACFEQQKAPAAGQPMIWDYHVIGFASSGLGSVIWDLDSALPEPSQVGPYLAATFPTLRPQHQIYSPWFRICAAGEFVRSFSSDRRHMQNPDGSWQQPPPAWPCIQTAGSAHNLGNFLDFTSNAPGLVLANPSPEELIAACVEASVRKAHNL